MRFNDYRFKYILLSIIIVSLSGFQSSVDKSQKYYEAGVEQFDNENYKDAVKKFNQAIEDDENNKDAYYKRGDYENALKDYSTVLEINP